MKKCFFVIVVSEAWLYRIGYQKVYNLYHGSCHEPDSGRYQYHTNQEHSINISFTVVASELQAIVVNVFPRDQKISMSIRKKNRNKFSYQLLLV